MDISKYRDNIELSDICVVVGDQEYNLHKFPLSINCDYFKNECKNQAKVVLKDFPGGKSSFEIVADHCYGKDVELTVENVVHLLCASEFLGMTGKSNLLEKCQKFIDRLFRGAEYSRSLDGVIELLESCKSMDTEKLKLIVDRGFTIILQIWLRPLSGYKSNMKEKYIEDSIVLETILNLDSYWIEKIIECAAVDESKSPYLAKLVVDYIDILIRNEENDSDKNPISQSTESANKKKLTRKISSSSLSSNQDNEELSNKDENLSDSEKLKITTQTPNSTSNESKKGVFDDIIGALPNDISLGKVVNVEWLQMALAYCNKYKCKSKNKLLQICGGMLTHVSIDELKQMDPKSVTEIIGQTLNNDKVDKELMKWIWDHHFLDMAQNAELDPAVFTKVVKNMPDSQNVDPDVVFKIVVSILNNIGTDSQKYKKELIETVDLEKISPENLEAAIESKFWEIEVICKIAIKRLKEKDKYKSQDKYFLKDSRSAFDTNLDSHVDSVGCYDNDNRISSGLKSRSYTSHLNSFPTTYDDEMYSNSPEMNYNFYPTSKYVHSTYSPDCYTALEENLKYELKKISESYSNYYKKRLRSRSRRSYPIAHQYQL